METTAITIAKAFMLVLLLALLLSKIHTVIQRRRRNLPPTLDIANVGDVDFLAPSTKYEITVYGNKFLTEDNLRTIDSYVETSMANGVPIEIGDKIFFESSKVEVIDVVVKDEVTMVYFTRYDIQ